MQPHKLLAISSEMAAVEQGNCELGILRIELTPLGQRARRRTELQAQIPKLLGEPGNRVAMSFFRAVVGEKKKQIDVGVREEPSTPEAAGGHQCQVSRARLVA